MTTIRRYADDTPQISKILASTTQEQIWIAYDQDSDGICLLKKAYFNSPESTNIAVEITTGAIADMKLFDGYLYVLLNGDSRVFIVYGENNPYTDVDEATKPYGIPEPVGITANNNGILVLLPGSTSGTNAKVMVYSLGGTYQSIIDLPGVYDATSIISDSSDNAWIVTNTNPAKLIRVWFASGGWYKQIRSITTPTLTNAMQIISYDSNPLFAIGNTTPFQIARIGVTGPDSPTWTVSTFTGATTPRAIAINTTAGYLYVACQDGLITKVNLSNLASYSIINVSDTDDLLTMDTAPVDYLSYASTNSSTTEFYTIDERTTQTISTNFPVAVQTTYLIGAEFSTIEAGVGAAKTISTNFVVLGLSNPTIDTRFSVLPGAYTSLNLTPMGRTDWHVYIDDVQLASNDLDLRSIEIRHTIGEESQASFTLARRHDRLDLDAGGNTSVITNQNTVKIYIGDHLEFTGKIAELEATYGPSTDVVGVVAYGTQPTEQYNLVTLPLPGLTESRNLYHIIVQNPRIFNPYIDPLDENPKKYLGVKVKLGKRITESVATSYHPDIYGSTAASLVGDGAVNILGSVPTVKFKPQINHTYFWIVTVSRIPEPVISGPEINTASIIGGFFNFQFNTQTYSQRYIGTSLAPVDGNIWNMTRATYFQQRDKDSIEYLLGDGSITVAQLEDAHTGLGSALFNVLRNGGYINSAGVIQERFKKLQPGDDLDIHYGDAIKRSVRELLEDQLGYTYGSAPFKEVSVRNGQYIPIKKYADTPTYMVSVLSEAYNFIPYAQKVAELEYAKISNINGDILPISSVDINLTLDAYYYYGIKLLTRVNIDNTTTVNIYNNNNGFPTSVKSITLSSGDMQVRLSTDNQKSNVELAAIDGEYPNENDYITDAVVKYLYPKLDIQRLEEAF